LIRLVKGHKICCAGLDGCRSSGIPGVGAFTLNALEERHVFDTKGSDSRQRALVVALGDLGVRGDETREEGGVIIGQALLVTRGGGVTS